MKTIEINGKQYQLDIEKAKEQGLLIEDINKPRSWQEYENNYYKESIYRGFCSSNFEGSKTDPLYNRFDTADEARAFCALGKLIQLRNAWWGDWRPDWTKGENKYDIYVYGDKLDVGEPRFCQCILSFPTSEMRDDFLNTFRPLIEQAKMFL